jgi:glycerol-1-phosphate dehydrogenase [NAD(P)+]
MDEILNLPLQDMRSLTFSCSCGKKHTVDIQKIILGKHLQNEIIDIVSDFKNRDIFMISDSNTNKVYGKKIYHLLIKNKFKIKQYVYEGVPILEPNEKALGEALIGIEPNTSLIMAVGSGTINDLSRYVSYKLKIPYIILPTAPSMDGYASNISSLMVNNFKTTYKTTYPLSIIADYTVMNKAPMNMIKAGFGDMIGKFISLADWKLSKYLNNEYYCETSAALVDNALNSCCKKAHRLKKKDEAFLISLFESLILSGIAMGLVGNSRPASGSEHHLAHYWEMDALRKRREHPLHGNSVGAAAVVISEIYKMINDINPLPLSIPKADEIREILIAGGCFYNPASLNVNKEVFKESILHAREIRATRFTILHLVHKLGLEKEIANRLIKIFYH